MCYPETVGVYDEYIPRPPLKCPRCHERQLGHYQGKGGPCRFLLWTQGEAAPTTEVDYERGGGWKAPADERMRLRLPSRFDILRICQNCGNFVEAMGICEADVWTKCVLGHFGHDPFGKDWFERDAEPIPAHPVDLRWRQCSRCTDAWEEDPGVELSQCPGCSALTMLVEQA